tara:strand:+ start:2585 stop:2767 length:183 start_codon:yes stop_codon:yes gene_type:complete
MLHNFAIALDLSPLSLTVIVISGLGFIIMFGISSAKGDFQGLAKTTLENDKAKRDKFRNK